MDSRSTATRPSWEYDHITPFLDYIFTAFGGSPGGQLVRHPLCASSQAQDPIDTTNCSATILGSTDSQGNPVKFSYGVTPSVTSNGQASDAVVWAMQKPDLNNPEGTAPGVLYAFDTITMQELYDTTMCAADAINPVTKFSVQTVANGYVYVGTESANTNGGNTGLGTFYIFGPRQGCN